MLSKELVAASSRPIILSVLAQGESYGYAIIQQVRDLSSGSLQYTDGMLYPVLHRLEAQGLIKSRWAASETGRKRKYYRLSRDGGTSLVKEREHWISVHNTLAKLWGIKSCPN